MRYAMQDEHRMHTPPTRPATARNILLAEGSRNRRQLERCPAAVSA